MTPMKSNEIAFCKATKMPWFYVRWLAAGRHIYPYGYKLVDEMNTRKEFNTINKLLEDTDFYNALEAYFIEQTTPQYVWDRKGTIIK